MPAPVEAGPDRRTLRAEVLLVLAVSLGQSGVYALVNLIGKLTASKALAEQTATLNASQAPGRPWLDLTYQVLGVVFAVVPALLAMHLLGRGGRPATRTIGLDLRRPGFDLGTGALVALAIGLPGLGLYFAARALGLAANVVPSALPSVWWAVPVLILSAVQNALLEEIVVVGYLVTRLQQLGWWLPAVIVTSALLRGSYHLYQGFGGFVGNAIMGVLFALFFLRTRRVAPLVVAHSLLDITAFVGYAALHSHVSWL
ncbi:CPBP family intramembrane glutamic endopeptidase [Actinocatenispora rupis]|uniref:CPBP family intramembrane glutamic endopeptidase n=1 Tax=Actinocatenispora rupis TaxID=519421 RepID=UPI0019403AED|nr:CPBP family intramembrane glutamic endopeptidase [Actinocatenispora rupis]